MFKKYNLEITKTLEEKKEGVDWKSTLSRHKLMIARIQHERLIHLLVMIFVGICFVLCFLTTVNAGSLLLDTLTLILMILFTAYIFHYRFLENTTQRWYEVEDEITELID